MKKTRTFRFWPALTSLLLFAGLCSIAAYWALQLLAPRPSVAPTESHSDQRGSGDGKALAELFGVAAAVTSAPAPVVGNIQVVGITAGDSKGSAILAVDGAPGRFFPIGATVTEGIKLVAVKPTAVVIERGGTRSEIPAPVRADLSVLTSGVGKTRQAANAAPPPAFGAAAAPASPVNPPPAQTVAPGSNATGPTPGQVTSPNIPNSSSVNPPPSSIGAAAPGHIPGAMSPPPIPGTKSF